MITFTDRVSWLRRWRRRFERSQARIRATMSVLSPDELTWSPDDGIPSLRDHLAEIYSARLTVQNVLRGVSDQHVKTLTPCRGNKKTVSIELLEASARTIVNELQRLESESDPEGFFIGDHEDLFWTNLDRETRASSALLVLTSLIDPSRLKQLAS